MKIEPQQIVVDVVVDRGSDRGHVARSAVRVRPAPCGRRLALRRTRSMARRLAVAMSQAPGLSGTPDCGHCSSAATSASCASSSAMPDVADDAGHGRR